LIKLTFREQEWSLEGKYTVRQAIEKVGLQPEAVLAVREGKLLTGDTRLKDGDEIKLVGVISGG
jgi:sulfur carrier protein ThiS